MGKSKKDIYTNSFGINATSYEFAFDFKLETVMVKQNNGTEPEIEKKIDNAALVRMSPQLAKVLLMMLDEQIKGFESQYGEIPNLINGGV